jgi:tartrate dehydrogenase/decarboxylase/D-malate dehydrogenase
MTSATKSNGIIFTMPFWDRCFHEIAADYLDVSTDQYHIDILTAHFVRHPDWFYVIVGSNLFLATFSRIWVLPLWDRSVSRHPRT